jgi:hypothetical protein
MEDVYIWRALIEKIVRTYFHQNLYFYKLEGIHRVYALFGCNIGGHGIELAPNTKSVIVFK